MNNQEIKDWRHVALKEVTWQKPVTNTTNKMNDTKKYLKLQQGSTIIRLKGKFEHTQIVGKYPPIEGRLIDRWMVPVQVRGRHNWKPIQYLSMGKGLLKQIVKIIDKMPQVTEFEIIVDRNAGPAGYYTVLARK